jgi:hypothetical protein
VTGFGRPGENSGPELCTQHETSQINIEEYVAQVLIDQSLIEEATGVDVMHIGHNGSENSTFFKLKFDSRFLYIISFQHSTRPRKVLGTTF